MNQLYYVSENMRFIRDKFNFSQEQFAQKTKLSTSLIQELESANDNTFYVTNMNTVAVSFICNYLTIPIDKFYLTDISKDLDTLKVMVDLLLEHKNGIQYDRGHFYINLLDRYREIQRSRINPVTITDALIKIHARVIDQQNELSNNGSLTS